MGNWFSINQGTSIDFDSEVDGEPSILKLSQEETRGHSNWQTDPKELKTSPPTSPQPPPNLGACNKFYQNENIHTERSNSAVRIPNESESHEPAIPILLESSPSNSDAANSVPSRNNNGVSINANHNRVVGNNNIIGSIGHRR